MTCMTCSLSRRLPGIHVIGWHTVDSLAYRPARTLLTGQPVVLQLRLHSTGNGARPAEVHVPAALANLSALVAWSADGVAVRPCLPRASAAVPPPEAACVLALPFLINGLPRHLLAIALPGWKSIFVKPEVQGFGLAGQVASFASLIRPPGAFCVNLWGSSGQL